MARPWRNAATLLVACRDKTRLTQYRILMVKRSGKSSFFANAHVFPGGVLDPADYSHKWWDIYPNEDSFMDFKTNNVWRAPLYNEPTDTIPAELAYRLCAVRETFEEAGVLLTVKKPGNEVRKELSRWRDVVSNDAGQFYSLCKEYDLVPDVWSLHEWCNWLTPASEVMKHEKPRRFDTIFYIACLSDSVLEASHDMQEVTETEWVDVYDMDRRYRNGDLILGPPQVYEIRRLQQFPTWTDLHMFASHRRHEGCERLLPVRMNCTDGVVSLLPGDADYPTPDAACDVSTIERDVSVSESGGEGEVEGMSRALHRIEMYSLHDTRIRCNIRLPCEQVVPRELSPPPRPLQLEDDTNSGNAKVLGGSKL